MFGYLIGGVLFFSPPLKEFFCASDYVTVISFDKIKGYGGAYCILFIKHSLRTVLITYKTARFKRMFYSIQESLIADCSYYL